jgi:hypothetical protein
MNFAIKHQITAGSQFDGQVPSTTPVATNGVLVYPTDVQGGLFEFGLDNYPVALQEVLVKLANQTSWTLKLIDGSTTFDLDSGTTETSRLYRPVLPLIMLPGQKIELKTVAATTAMWAAAVYARAPIGES